MIRAVLFDFNGVLVDDEPIHFRLLREAMSGEGIDADAVLPEELYWSELVGLDDHACIAEILARTGWSGDPGQVTRLVARKSSLYRELIRREGYPFFPGAVELVRNLAAAGTPLGLVSGALRAEVEGALAQEGLRPFFEVVVTADDVTASKPDPEGYRKGIEALNGALPVPDRLLQPHEILCIEDTAAGVAAARAAGLTVLAVAHTFPQEALRVADRVVPKVGELRVEEILGMGS